MLYSLFIAVLIVCSGFVAISAVMEPTINDANALTNGEEESSREIEKKAKKVRRMGSGKKIKNFVFWELYDYQGPKGHCPIHGAIKWQRSYVKTRG